MLVGFARYRVGDPRGQGALTVFPLFAATAEGVDYVLAAEALSDRSVVIEEVSEAGTVAELVVENRGESRVLFLEGEELVGAKQNRVLNTSVLVAARSRTKIPVSCVEQGRWRYRDRNLETSGSFSTTKIRLAVKASVARALRERRGHRSDQSTVWREVDELQTSRDVASETHALCDVYDAYRDRVADLQDALPYVGGAVGMAVAVGGKVVALDVFDKPSTCSKVWRGLLSGFVFDALEAEAGRPAAGDVERLLAAAREAAWDAVEPVGEGEEYRAELGRDHASALCAGGFLVHGSISAVAA